MENETAESRPVGRPRTPVDPDLIYKLAAIHCTNKEIASIVGIHIDSLQRHHKDLLAAGRENGKGRLRRKMWEQALAGNVTMMIWLSKNHLGMTDNIMVSEDKRPLPWTDSDEQTIVAEPTATTEADGIVYTPVHADLDQLAADMKF